MRLAEKRTEVALSQIRKIGNLSNKGHYEWDEQDVDSIVDALLDSVSEMERRFDPQRSSEQQFRLSRNSDVSG